MTPELLRREAARSREDEAAFDAFAAEVGAQFAVFASAVLLFGTLAWWPLDAVVWPEDRYATAFFWLRVRASTVELLSLALFAASARARQRSLVVAPAMYVLFVVAIGYSLGELGGPDLTWLADAALAVLPPVLLPLRLRARLVVTGAVAAALLGSFFLPFAANRAVPTASAQVAFLAFASLSSVLAGELATRLTRQNFFQKRELDKANAALARLTDDLSLRVAEQTQELRDLALHLERAQESERRRIARELHDDFGQRLTAMRLTLARVERRVGERDDDLPELLNDLSALVDGASGATRDFVSELRPRVLDDYGLVAAVEWLCERVRAREGMRCDLTVSPGFPDGVALPDPESALCLFRVTQEATTNALKHARASALDVSLSVEGDVYSVTVRDDGVGFDPDAHAQGFGLLGLRERLRAVDGTLSLDARPGRGTRVTAALRAAPTAPEEPS
ncbi:MAG: sensor histidine kinase [Polyangiales bacterium]